MWWCGHCFLFVRMPRPKFFQKIKFYNFSSFTKEHRFWFVEMLTLINHHVAAMPHSLFFPYARKYGDKNILSLNENETEWVARFRSKTESASDWLITMSVCLVGTHQIPAHRIHKHTRAQSVFDALRCTSNNYHRQFTHVKCHVNHFPNVSWTCVRFDQFKSRCQRQRQFSRIYFFVVGWIRSASSGKWAQANVCVWHSRSFSLDCKPTASSKCGCNKRPSHPPITQPALLCIAHITTHISVWFRSNAISQANGRSVYCFSCGTQITNISHVPALGVHRPLLQWLEARSQSEFRALQRIYEAILYDEKIRLRHLFWYFFILSCRMNWCFSLNMHACWRTRVHNAMLSPQSHKRLALCDVRGSKNPIQSLPEE